MGRNLVKNEKGQFAVQSSIDDETIVTPWFDTKQDVIEHLVAHGDDHRPGPVKREHAEKFVEWEHVPSMVISPGKGLLSNYETAGAL